MTKMNDHLNNYSKSHKSPYSPIWLVRDEGEGTFIVSVAKDRIATSPVQVIAIPIEAHFMAEAMALLSILGNQEYLTKALPDAILILSPDLST